ncbi:MAG: protein kinase, partial [Chloroflexota bacterium]
MMTNTTNQHSTIHNRHQLHEKLGQGGMGMVYRATDRLTGETVALKRVVLSKDMQNTHRNREDELRLALAHEFQTLAGLRHPHIISVLDYGFDQERQPFFTMTYLPQAQTFLEAGSNQPFERQVALIQQLFQALAYLHRRGVLHRDLKPANVLVQDDVVRVLDFGLATTAERTSSSSGGTPLYMAPELFEGVDYSRQADLFAVGILITEMVTGKHPFGPVDFSFLDRVAEDAPNLSDMDDGLQAVVWHLLAKEPRQRLRSAAQSIQLLDQALDAEVGPGYVEPAPIRESYLQAATFVGREVEMAQLTDALAEAAAGHGSAWLVGGESGVGKSRLLQEIRPRALIDEFMVLMGEAVEDSVGGLYDLWFSPLRHLVSSLNDVSDLEAGVLLPLIPDIATLLGRPVQPAPALDGEAAQVRLFSTITQLFGRAQQPILLILEDLHWSETALAIIPYLLHKIETRRLVIITSYRDDERPELAETLSALQPLPLQRLTENEMDTLSVAMLGDVGERENVQQLLRRETEGNAFFAVEILRALAEEMGSLQDIGDMVLPETLLPDGIQTIVQRRLERIPKADQALLQMAAIAGRVLDMKVLASLHTQPISEQWLATCTDASVLDVVEDTWQFQHAKIREGLLATIPIETAKIYHQQVAEAIEQVYPENPQFAARLMIHWQHVGHPEKEYIYAYQAGIYAAAQYANDDAIDYLTRAYTLVSSTDMADPEKQYQTLLAREKVYAHLGQADAQQVDLNLLTKLVEQDGQP